MTGKNENIADVIIIGGGAAGCSTAMQLALRGQRVIVLEKGRLGSGSTAQAAGLGAQLRSSADETRLLKEGLGVVTDLESRLEKELFVRTGCLHVATTDGSGVTESVLVRDFDQSATDASRDGQFLALHENHPETGQDIYLLRLEEGSALVPFAATEHEERSAVHL